MTREKICILADPRTIPVIGTVQYAWPSLSRQPSQAMWRRVCYVKYLET